MKPEDAIANANQILDEERISPTVRYQSKTGGAFGAKLRMALRDDPYKRPRPVEENPANWILTGVNYTLFCALHSQADETSRSAIRSAALERLTPGKLDPICRLATEAATHPNWQGMVSELPLVAEFCLRNGAVADFFDALGNAGALPGHAVLLRHLEDMIALNFTVLSDDDYRRLDSCLVSFKALAEQLRTSPSGQSVWKGNVAVDPMSLLGEIVAASDGLREQCRKARYLYLKGNLLEGVNLEVNQDKEVVQSYLLKFGLSEMLGHSLNEADQLYQGRGTAFALKSSMGHLRSFLETFHLEILRAVQVDSREELPASWGQGLHYLRNKLIISKSEEKFVAGLYTLISDEAVHPLLAEREYARLTRNVVIEYALLLLRKIEKLELKLP